LKTFKLCSTLGVSNSGFTPIQNNR
jgi:hypothetical protein